MYMRCVLPVLISIHALLAESDRNARPETRQPCAISIHALLAESDGNESGEDTNNSNFYPRSPCGERLNQLTRPTREISISIHALLAESDRSADYNCRNARPISIHALLAESDAVVDNIIFMPWKFLSTLSLRRATAAGRFLLS